MSSWASLKNTRRMGLKVKSKKVSIGDRGGGGGSHSHHRSANDASDPTDPHAISEPPPMLKPPVSVVAQGTLTPEEEAAIAAAAAAAAAAEEGDGVVTKGKKGARGPMSVILPPTDQAVGTQTLSQYLNRMRVAPVVRACMLDREHRDEALEVILNTAERFPWDCGKIAQAVKHQLDDRMGPNWHCIVGEAYGYEVTFENRGLVSILYGSLAVLAWKCGTALLAEAEAARAAATSHHLRALLFARKKKKAKVNPGQDQQEQEKKKVMVTVTADEDDDDDEI